MAEASGVGRSASGGAGTPCGRRFQSLLPVLTVLACLVGCGESGVELLPLSVDSLTVTPIEAPGSFRIRAHRWITACQSSVDVRRETREDSLVRRFVLRVEQRRDILCPAMPWALNFAETVRVVPGGASVYVVRQADGTSLVRDLSTP